MIDENAFGVLFSYHGIEDDEYDEEPAEFVDRFLLFQRLLLSFLEEQPPAPTFHAFDLGHALYVEVEEGSQTVNLISWVKAGTAVLKEQQFNPACFLSHGGRWVQEAAAPSVELHRAGSVPITSVSKPSEPLRRALSAETASHGLPTEDLAWGPGVYLDTDVVEALKLNLKNQPTLLHVAGADFFRIAR